MAEGIGMEKSTASRPKKYDHWEVRDAMHTILRAGEHLKNKALMKHVRKQAAEHAKEKQAESHRASELAKRGLISEKQMAKLGNRHQPSDREEAANLDKMTPIA
jgi:hypothetical protein